MYLTVKFFISSKNKSWDVKVQRKNEENPAEVNILHELSEPQKATYGKETTTSQRRPPARPTKGRPPPWIGRPHGGASCVPPPLPNPCRCRILVPTYNGSQPYKWKTKGKGRSTSQLQLSEFRLKFKITKFLCFHQCEPWRKLWKKAHAYHGVTQTLHHHDKLKP